MSQNLLAKARGCLFLVCLALLSSCATLGMAKKLTPEKQAYLTKVESEPLEFTTPKTQAEEAWGRAQSFIGLYSSMKLQIATDFVIQTHNPARSDVKFGYYVTKSLMGDNAQITVQCTSGNMFAGTYVQRNAHIFAHYIKTGELPYPELITK